MRYFIKAYPMHESEVYACTRAGIEESEVAEGLVQGIADEATIQTLADAGVVVQAVAKVPEEAEGGALSGGGADGGPDPGPNRVGLSTVGFGTMRREPAVATVGAPAMEPGYLLVELLLGVTDRVVETLRQAGAEIVERDLSGRYLVNASGGPEPLRRLPFIGDIRAYGIEETIEGTEGLMAPNPEMPDVGARATATRPRAARKARATSLFEAVLHSGEDKQSVAAAMAALGATVVSQSSRALRFVPKDADLRRIAALPGVASVSRTRAARLFHDLARPLIGLAPEHAGGAGLPFDGAGEVVGVADTGLDDAHPDFHGRIDQVVALGRPGDGSDPDGHGTHVAGSVLGSGVASNKSLAGMAPGARLYFQSVLDANGGLGGLPDSLLDLFEPAYNAGVRIHNNSWGAYLQARYDSMALEVDEFVWDHPDFLPVIAAGNEGTCRSPLHSAEGFVDFPSLGSPATAKNGLTVGASRSSRTKHGMSGLSWSVAWPDDFPDAPIADERVSGDDQGLAAFSSRGPCEDMRIKPDVVAPGTDVASTRSKDAPLAHFWGAYPNNPRYAFMGGTSMASPIVTGCLALVRQYYRRQLGFDTPSAALLKATLINGTRQLSGQDSNAPLPGFPNYHQGFGRIDMGATLPHPAQPAFDLMFADTWKRDSGLRFTQRQGRRRWRIGLAADGEVRICCVWTDPPAKGLQNALRLILDDSAGRKWIANDGAAAPLKFASHDPRDVLPGNNRVVTRDPMNNVQIIRAGLSAGSYTLALFADTLLRVPQDFALVVTGPAGATVVQEAN